MIFPKICWWLFVICLEDLGVPQINNIGFESQGHVHKSRNHAHDGLSVSPSSKSTSDQSQMKQNNPTELLSISVSSNYNENGP